MKLKTDFVQRTRSFGLICAFYNLSRTVNMVNSSERPSLAIRLLKGKYHVTELTSKRSFSNVYLKIPDS